jgi:hypothetical protein
MKYLKMLGLAAVAAMALMAVVAGSASATTLEVGGTAKNESVTITASLKAGTSAILTDTFGFSSNTCTESHVHGSTTSADIGGKTFDNTYTGDSLTGPLTEESNGLSFGKCTREPVTAHKSGELHITWISGTTNGTVTSSGAEVTTGSPFGTLNCKTGEGTHLGILTGVAKTTEHATMDINAVLSCSGVSSKWEATYIVTTPTGLGVVS